MIAAPLAYEMKLPLVLISIPFFLQQQNGAILIPIAQVLIRKSSKSPGSTIGVDFRVGYGTEHLEIADDAVQVSCSAPSRVMFKNLKRFQPGQRVFIVDDLLGSGTTMQVIFLVTARFYCRRFTAIGRPRAISSNESAASSPRAAAFA